VSRRFRDELHSSISTPGATLIHITERLPRRAPDQTITDSDSTDPRYIIFTILNGGRNSRDRGAILLPAICMQAKITGDRVDLG
jgi:hypothetical protein